MSTDPQSLILESLAGGANIEDVVAQMSAADPRFNLVAQYLAHRRAAVEEADESDESETLESETDTRERRESLPARERIEAIQSLQRLARTMYAELEELRERNDALASAVGACYLCWGEDFECAVCGGRGEPGWLQPDRSLFSQLVAPALRWFRNPPAEPSGESVRRTRSVTERTPNLNKKPN
jgi:hypothetical protein